MPQKILIAMDDSENARRAVRFVAQNFSPANEVTLFNVMLDTAALCEMNSPELTPLFKTQQNTFCMLEDKKRELVKTAMNAVKKELVQAGFDAERIKIKVETKNKSVAADIIGESQKGYDLLVVGRHGAAGIKDFFLGSTSQKVFNAAREISVLIVN